MEWFKRVKEGVFPQKKKDLPEGIWIRCEKCKEILYRKELEKNLKVCFKCGHHFRIGAKDYIKLILDKDSFSELDGNLKSVDPLKFKDTKKYKDRLKEAIGKTKMNEAIITGFGKINGRDVVFGAMDFRFIGGSMGSVVGEKVKRATEKAMDKMCPLIIVCASGGARMMEGPISLMQMAKTSTMLAKFSQKKGIYITVLTNPTTAGVMASFAMLGDIIIAEPGALLGFAGPRVIKQTIGEDLPEGFQSSEFLQEHGFVDLVVPRGELRNKLIEILNFFYQD
ncbi:acetyl-CoA carboxylase carboxyl transferase subunit beta [candidate division KSB1 bacterium]|nr:MAG: acetyl-CoA carboxylase carboxyl transferase subunit beta [candidate division KSB1 bacterium]